MSKLASHVEKIKEERTDIGGRVKGFPEAEES